MSTAAYRYRYNGKEQLSRFSGRYDYGFRMYDPGVGRFLSVDPLTKKYPELSPYAAVANSPIAYKEMDGRDFELVINHDTKEIIVKATYYVLESDKDTKAKLEKAVGVWNSQNKFKYTFESDKQCISYSITFDLKVETTKDLKTVPLSFTHGNARTSNNTVSNSPRSLKEHNKDNDENRSNSDTYYRAAAFTSYGNEIYIDNKTNGIQLQHEIGHTLGVGHLQGDELMSYSGGSGKIDVNVISTILPMTASKVQTRLDNFRPGKSRYKKIGKEPESFKDGKVE